MDHLRKRIEPLKGGIQIQNRKRKGIGTLACIVYDIETGQPCGLSNKHILRKRIGFTVIQPALKLRINKYVIGTVFRKSRILDCAIFLIDTNKRSIDQENSIYGLEGRINETIEPIIGMKVQKVGQYTGHTVLTPIKQE